MGPPQIRLARSHEHEMISSLALRSKAHWGYSDEFLQACRAELTYSPDACGSGLMWTVETSAGVVGFAHIDGEPPTGELTALFVDPVAIGTGCGTSLLRHVLNEATERGFTRLELDADPQAAGFYRHHGARPSGTTPSGSIPGRVLPHLVFELQCDDA